MGEDHRINVPIVSVRMRLAVFLFRHAMLGMVDPV
jgi:hypothetical protein